MPEDRPTSCKEFGLLTRAVVLIADVFGAATIRLSAQNRSGTLPDRVARSSSAGLCGYPGECGARNAVGLHNQVAIDMSAEVGGPKSTRVTEPARLQSRAEAINAMNHPQFTPPNTTPTRTFFGAVTGEFAWPCVIL